MQVNGVTGGLVSGEWFKRAGHPEKGMVNVLNLESSNL
jgi:hypothetical protein